MQPAAETCNAAFHTAQCRDLLVPAFHGKVLFPFPVCQLDLESVKSLPAGVAPLTHTLDFSGESYQPLLCSLSFCLQSAAFVFEVCLSDSDLTLPLLADGKASNYLGKPAMASFADLTALALIGP